MSWKLFNENLTELEDYRTIPKYLIPQAYKIDFTAESHVLSISFRYISDDKATTSERLPNTGATLFKGAKTGRVYKIEILLPDYTTLSDLEKILTHVVDNLASSNTNASNRWKIPSNFTRTERVLQESDRLLHHS